MADAPLTPWAYARRAGYPAITEVAPSPDRQRVAYVVREPLLSEDQSRFISQVYLASSMGGAPIQLTSGEHCNDRPRWSPDGRHVAYVSTRSGRANVFVTRASGGELWALTNYEDTDIAALRWAPDGASLAFLRVEPPSVEAKTRRMAKDDAIRWGQDVDFTHLFVVPFRAETGALAEARQITRGRFTVLDFDWLPDGAALAVTHRPTPFNDSWPDTRLGIVPIDGDGTPRDLGRVATFGGRPAVSPDGAWVACLTGDLPARWAFAGGVVLHPVAGGEPRPLARTPDEEPDLLGWSADGRDVYVEEDAGTTRRIYALPTSGEAARPLTTGELVVSGAAGNGADQIAFVGQGLDRPNAVYRLDARTGESRCVAQPALPAGWPAEPLASAEVVRWRAPDGWEIEGILTYPLGYRAGQHCPLIVLCHGGLKSAFLASPGYFADQMDLAERGYAILRPSPRGSSGYGRAFRFAIYDWGANLRDVLAGVDALVARGVADPARLGIAGWSIWGYPAACAIAQTDRFKAACVGGALTNLASVSGTGDSPSLLPDCLGAEPWDDPATYFRHSPVFNVARIRTPTLILHGERDARVPLGQARELYNALKRQGVPVELAIYPRQGHVVDEPRLLIDLQRRTAAWFDRWVRELDG